MNKYAPIAVYTYNRFEHFRQTITALEKNIIAKESTIYIVSDAAASEKDEENVKKIREFSKKIKGFLSVELVFRQGNLGPAKSIFGAEREIIDLHGKIISMEDDNLTSSNFLSFMNSGLEYFKDEPSVYSICGYCPPVDLTPNLNSDIWFYPWNISWGYATWKHKYDLLNPLINNYEQLKENGILKKINRMGGLYITDSLKRDYKKQAHFPDAVLCSNMTRLDMVSVLPMKSKVLNIGNDGSGTSRGVNTDKYNVELDDGGKLEFSFECNKIISMSNTKKIAKFYNGKKITQIARYLGVYQNLLQLKQFYK